MGPTDPAAKVVVEMDQPLMDRRGLVHCLIPVVVEVVVVDNGMVQMAGLV
jgi:hypothetical protein